MPVVCEPTLEKDTMAFEYGLDYDNGAGGIDGVASAAGLSYFNPEIDNFRYANDVLLESTGMFRSIFSATEEEVPFFAFGAKYNNFVWASGVGEPGHESTFV